MRRILWLWLPVLIWMAVIFHLSSQTTQPHLPQPGLDVIMRKVAHMAEYAVLALLLYRARQGSLSPARDGKALAFALGVALVYAISDEWHQGLVPGREPSPVDVTLDVSGAGLALLACKTAGRCLRPSPTNLV